MLRSRPLAASAAALLSTAALFGCGGAPTTPTALCVEQIKVSCAFQYQCCTDAEDRNRFLGGSFAAFSLFSSGASTTEAECVESGTALCQAFGGIDDASLERGRIEYDVEAATRCLDNQRDALSSCDVELLRGENDDCREAVVGLGQDGDPCITSGECGDDAACDIEVDSDGLPRRVDEDFALPEGECVELAGEGDDCDERDCLEDLFCNDEGRCQEFAREGEDCLFAQCDFDSFCNEFDVCERDVIDDDDEEDFNFCRG